MAQATTEKVVYSDSSIPVKAYVTDFQGYVGPHTHSEVEWLFMLEGCMKIKIFDDTIFLAKGEAILINAHVAHSTDNHYPESTKCILQFDPDVLIHNALASEYKYAMPFICAATAACCITGTLFKTETTL